MQLLVSFKGALKQITRIRRTRYKVEASCFTRYRGSKHQRALPTSLSQCSSLGGENAVGLLGMANNAGTGRGSKAEIKMLVFIIAFTMVPGRLPQQGSAG